MIIWRYQKAQSFTHRMIALGFIFLFVCFVLIGRLFYLQIFQGEKYQLMAERNRISMRLTLPPRGNIFDRNGVKLAGNRKTFQAILIKEQTKDVKQTLDSFSKLIPLDSEERARIEKEISRKRAFMPVRIKEDLTFDEIAAIQLNIPDLPGISIEEGFTRFYPEKEATTHAVGYVSLILEEDVEGDDPLLDLPGYRIGRSGVEQSQNDWLKGTPGMRKTEVNAFGRSVRILEDNPPIPGHDLTLTIDSRLQKIATQAAGDESASIILLNVQTGEVLALVSTPSFDPNLFNRPIPQNVWNKLINNPKRPMRNKTIADIYSPGSIFKLVVALAGLESGDITLNKEIYCSGKTRVGNQQFHCWKREGHGHLNVIEALQHSCDVYFYEISQKIGVDKISEMAARLGFGSLTGIDLIGEKAALLPTRQWKEENRHDSWRIGDTLNLSIGQGFLNATPIQMAKMAAQIANDGHKITPHLIQKENETGAGDSLNLKPAHLKMIQSGMASVMNEEGGTGYGSRFNLNGQKMAGKTASTQVRRITLKEREEGIKSQDELAWEHRDHGIFVGFAPLNKPKYAIAVVVEHGGGGARSAAPIASKILKEAIRLDMTSPTSFSTEDK